MAPVKPGSYTFRKDSLAKLRQRFGLSQAQMAAKLGIPKNTLSRWETGATTPDAHSLAAIYSVAKEEGIMPTFFAPVKRKTIIRDTALVYWDTNSVTPSWNVGEWDTFIVTEVNKRVPKPKNSQFKVFSSSSMFSYTPAISQLQDLDWDIWEGDADIAHHALSESGQNPDTSVVFLITQNMAYVDLIKRLSDDGVLVYVMAPSSVSDVIIEAVGQRRWINLDGLPGLPVVIKVKSSGLLGEIVGH